MADNEVLKPSKFVKNLTGKTFGRLTVQSYQGVQSNGHAEWLCICSCGNSKITTGGKLLGGRVRSCGCLEKESRGKAWRTHGLSRTPEHWAWFSMKQRCLNPKVHNYSDYGGRGIKVCDEWKDSFENFYRDMGKKPTPQHSLDRIDVNGPYDRQNTRWATKREQSNNRRNNRILEFNGERMTVSQWTQKLGFREQTLRARLRVGWSVERALTQPEREPRPHNKNGDSDS